MEIQGKRPAKNGNLRNKRCKKQKWWRKISMRRRMQLIYTRNVFEDSVLVFFCFSDFELDILENAFLLNTSISFRSTFWRRCSRRLKFLSQHGYYSLHRNASTEYHWTTLETKEFFDLHLTLGGIFSRKTWNRIFSCSSLNATSHSSSICCIQPSENWFSACVIRILYFGRVPEPIPFLWFASIINEKCKVYQFCLEPLLRDPK